MICFEIARNGIIDHHLAAISRIKNEVSFTPNITGQICLVNTRALSYLCVYCPGRLICHAEIQYTTAIKVHCQSPKGIQYSIKNDTAAVPTTKSAVFLNFCICAFLLPYIPWSTTVLFPQKFVGSVSLTIIRCNLNGHVNSHRSILSLLRK